MYIYGLLNDAVSSSDYKGLNSVMIIQQEPWEMATLCKCPMLQWELKHDDDDDLVEKLWEGMWNKAIVV